MIELDFSGVSTSMKDDLRTVTSSTGVSKSLFVQIDPNGTSEAQEILYVKFTDIPNPKADGIGPDGDITWAMKISLEEQL